MIFKKVRELIGVQLRQGVSPQGLALTCSIAAVLATFPIVGATTLVCILIGVALKLNQPLMQTVNYLMTPVHLLLLPIFVKIGEWLVGAEPISLNPQAMMHELMTDWRLFLSDYGLAGLHAILAWCLLAPVAGVLLYQLLLRIFIRLKRQSHLAK